MKNTIPFPYEISWLNVILITLIVFLAIVMRKIIHRSLKKYLAQANIRLEGKRITYLKLFSQSVYAIAFFLCIYQFKINNKNFEFNQFLSFPFYKAKNFQLTFENVFIVVCIIFSARVLVNILTLRLSQKMSRNKSQNRGTEYVYVQLIKYCIYIFAFFFSLRAMKVDASLFLGGSAALLVGLGLGLQDVFKDMFSGFVLLFEGVIRVGDVIELHDGKSKEAIVAKILKINIRTTQIETRDGNVLIVPNAKLTQEYIENWSHGTTHSRFRLNVTVSYGSNTQLISDLMIQAAMSHPKVLKEEGPQVRLVDFAENGLLMELIFWADQSWDINQYRSEIRFEIDRLFRHYKILIPYPQREIHVNQKNS
jgi:small-conductance mechanosensitive channel